MFFKKGVLKIPENWKTAMLESYFNKVKALQACNFIRERLQHRCFPVNIAKYLRTVFLWNTSGSCFLIKKQLIREKFTFREKLHIQDYNEEQMQLVKYTVFHMRHLTFDARLNTVFEIAPRKTCDSSD